MKNRIDGTRPARTKLSREAQQVLECCQEALDLAARLKPGESVVGTEAIIAMVISLQMPSLIIRIFAQFLANEMEAEKAARDRREPHCEPDGAMEPKDT